MSTGVAHLSGRQAWLRTLSCSEPLELERLAQPFIDRLGGDAFELRPTEVGLTMVTGRVGGTGEPFGLGEMTVTRCVVQLGDRMGVGYVRGRDHGHARRIAIVDALLQGPHVNELMVYAIQPLAEMQLTKDGLRAEQTASTRVQFLTMVRGS